MPGGQFTNLRQQAKSLGLEGRWHEVARAYAEANRVLGDIVKVTPSSKVVGDLALFMVTNDLKADDLVSAGAPLSFPRSVIEMLQGMLGEPEGGWPAELQRSVLESARVSPIAGRPGVSLPAVDFAAATSELRARTREEPTHADVLSYVLYPQVFLDFVDHRKQFGDTSVIPTPNFFYGMQPGEEIAVAIEKGKTLIIRFLTVGDVRVDGTRTAFFELNGQPREVRVVDRSADAASHQRAQAEPGNANHIAAPMPGKIATVSVRKSDHVKQGDRLLSIEAMKMETAVYSPRDGVVQDVHVQAGTTVDAKDLLVTLAAV
jgi:pyruvate carboxylase